MKELVLAPLIDEPKILSDFEYTWTVDNWRGLSKKEHGPIFEAGGYPWYDTSPPNQPAYRSCRSSHC